jgi:acyl-[acyl-carrier-protein]-phospholipid O-acyltransferase/long-chain-fatty-acid--[acyl-carrier-protein] ligase
MAEPATADLSGSTLWDALLAARARHGGKKLILEDADRKPLSYDDLVRAAFALGRKLKPITEPGERVALLLPTSVGGVVAFFALHAIGRTPVMLNFTATPKTVRAAMSVAGVKRVLSAKRFIQQAKLEDLAREVEADAAVTWLDDVRKTIGKADKLFALTAGFLPKSFLPKEHPDDPGVILFTSGSFGAPKGVVLSQANLTANSRQISTHIALDPAWVMFNPLPFFHSLGLTAGIFVPLLNGLRVFEYPSPLHVKQIPRLVRESGAAVLFGTDTFANQYARAAEPGDLDSLLFLVCGAEKVRPETQKLYGATPVLEGYGATECSPVIAVNHPDRNRPGTVGQLLPGMEARLEAVEGIPEGGRLFVRGPNVMAGYLGPDGRPEPPPGGWHDTGDVAAIDAEGMVRLLGRLKRFAKIAGEMVSLTAVEDLASKLWPDARHAVVAVPDSKKGERLILVTERLDAGLPALAAFAKAEGAPEIAVPRRVVHVHHLPLLGSGKLDYGALQILAEQQAAA